MTKNGTNLHEQHIEELAKSTNGETSKELTQAEQIALMSQAERERACKAEIQKVLNLYGYADLIPGLRPKPHDTIDPTQGICGMLQVEPIMIFIPKVGQGG